MSRPSRILITGARAPVAVHLCRLLADDRCAVVLADTYKTPLGEASTLHSGYVQLPPPRYDLDGYGARLAQTVEAHDIDLIIPTCEEVFYLAILEDRGLLKAPLFAPGLGLLRNVHNKFAFIELARSFGLPVPETRLIPDAAGLRDIAPTDKVFKPVWSRFANDVLIKPTHKDITKISVTLDAPWVAQDFVDGQEISVYAIAKNGKLAACAPYVSLFRAGKGAGVCFAPVQDAAITDWVTRFVEASGWNGQISFDMIRQSNGSVLPLECNPRAVSGLHFFRNKAAFQATFWDGTPAVPDVTKTQASRLAMWLYGLPQAIKSNRLSEFRTTLRTAQDILFWDGDPGPLGAQFRTVREIAGIAMRQRISLQQASTRDIEWNGP